jgi:hypothetical protein
MKKTLRQEILFRKLITSRSAIKQFKLGLVNDGKFICTPFGVQISSLFYSVSVHQLSVEMAS